MGGILGAIIDPLAVQRETRQQDLQAEGLRQRNIALQLEAEQHRMENEQRRRALRDMDILQRAYVNTDRTPMSVQRYAISNGITPAGWKAHVDALRSAAQLNEDTLKAEDIAHKQVGQILDAIDKAPADQQGAIVQQNAARLQALEPNADWGSILASPEQRKAAIISHGYAGTVLDQAGKAQQQAFAEAKRKEEEGAAARAEALAPVTRAHIEAQTQELLARLETAAANAARLAATEAERERHNRAMEAKQTETGTGTWQLQEDAQGNPVLFNSKTAETKPAPPNMLPKGTAAREAPARDALAYARSYLDSGQFTGSGDEALMAKYLELAKFRRVNQAQLNMVMSSRSVFEGAAAKLRHAIDPNAPWFDSQQRKNILATMERIEGSRQANSGVPSRAEPGGASQIRVKRKSDGKIGTMPAGNFDASKYDKL